MGTQSSTRVTIEVQLFASAREALGTSRVELDVPEGCTVAECRDELVRRFPRLAALIPHVRWALNVDYVDETARVQPGDQLALIPPVSGG